MVRLVIFLAIAGLGLDSSVDSDSASGWLEEEPAADWVVPRPLPLSEAVEEDIIPDVG